MNECQRCVNLPALSHLTFSALSSKVLLLSVCQLHPGKCEVPTKLVPDASSLLSPSLAIYGAFAVWQVEVSGSQTVRWTALCPLHRLTPSRVLLLVLSSVSPSAKETLATERGCTGKVHCPERPEIYSAHMRLEEIVATRIQNSWQKVKKPDLAFGGHTSSDP